MLDEVYIISKFWVDPYENSVSGSCGYEIEGFVYTLSEAEKIVSEGGKFRDRCWSVSRTDPPDLYIFKRLGRFGSEPIK